MTAQPDIIWNEQCLGIRIGEQVCTYLKKHDAEYQRLQNKILELTERYPVIETFMESNQAISLTTEEHKAVHQYFRLESEKEMIEEQYHFYMGQAQMISYGAMLGKIKKAILGNEKIQCTRECLKKYRNMKNRFRQWDYQKKSEKQ